MSTHDRSTSDMDQHDRDQQVSTEQLMMPGTYRPRRHRDRSMPQRKPRLTAKESEKSTLKWTSQSEPRER